MPPLPAAPAPAPGRAPPAPARTPEPRPAPGAEPEAEAGPAFELRLGDLVHAIPLVGDAVTVSRDAYTVDLSRLPVALPGVSFERLRLRRGANGVPVGGTLSGAISVPFVRGRAELTVDANGDVSGSAQATFDVEVLGRPRVTFSYLDRRFSGSVTVEGRSLRLPIPNVTVEEGSATVAFDGRALSGSLTATFRHAALGTGDVSVSITSEGIAGGGGFRLTMPLLEGSNGTFAVDRDGKLSADLALSAADVQVPIPGVTLSSLTGNVALRDGHVSGTAGLVAAYAGLATVTVAEVAVSDRGFGRASGTIDVTAPPFQGSQGRVTVDDAGRVSGQLTIAAEQIPIPALRRGSITVRLRPDGGVDVSGTGRVEIAGIGGGDFSVGWADGVLSLGADVSLTVPGLQPVTGRLDWRDGDLSGEVQTGIAVGPLTGNVLLRYAANEFSGEGRLDYAVGRFSGWVLLRVDPQGQVSGEGEATVQLADWLRGTIGLTVLPDLNVDARGEIVVPSGIELFPAWRFERSFFSFRQSFPLWGITIPVVGSIGIIAEVNASAGFRAAFGPGTFENIRAEGEISTRPETEPSFSISGDLVIPAGAEIVLSVGGGIGLAALIAQITGGIALEGIAGVYGSITLTPTFAYRDGEYSLRGDALLEAAAQLRARINAYASIVAGIGWFSTEVWRRDWNLAEWGFDTGWSVGLRAGVQWVIGQPFVPQIDFEEVDVDPTAIIRRAIPNSGEPVPAPPRAVPPVATFTPADGTATTGSSAAGGPAPSEPASVPTETAPAGPAGPAAPGVSAGETPPGAAAPPAEGQAPPIVEPPPAEAEEPEQRDVEETYLVYVYESIDQYLRRKKAPTAPTDEELLRRAAPPPEREEEERRRRPADPSVDPVPVPEDEERSGAKPLSPGVRARMEQIFDADLSGVRVHTDEAARRSARRLGAEAYTVGEHVYFGPSRDPDAGDDELLAHELAHVVQGPGGETGVSQPGEPVEREAEEAARAVKRGEKPLPIRRRDEGSAVRRQATSTGADEGQRVDAGARVPFTLEQWNRIKNDPALAQNASFAAAIAALETLPQVTARSKDDVFDATSKAWRKRTFVPMHFPASTYLPHRSVTGETNIAAGKHLVRAEGVREDTSQNLLSRLMYAAGPEARAEAAGSAGWFTRSERGTYDKEAAWADYIGREGYQPLHAQPDPATREQLTSESAHNLNLRRSGFDTMWDSWTFVFTSGRWRRPAGYEPGGQAAATDGTDAAARAIMVADYEAHHVIPLWLRSADGMPDGDQLANLAPWHKTAHQTNHAWHHAVPPDVRAATGVADYREFNPGTPFLLHELAAANRAHPAGSPPVQLDTSSAEPRWVPGPGGKPIWAPDLP